MSRTIVADLSASGTKRLATFTGSREDDRGYVFIEKSSTQLDESDSTTTPLAIDCCEREPEYHNFGVANSESLDSLPEKISILIEKAKGIIDELNNYDPTIKIEKKSNIKNLKHLLVKYISHRYDSTYVSENNNDEKLEDFEYIKVDHNKDIEKYVLGMDSNDNSNDPSVLPKSMP